MNNPRTPTDAVLAYAAAKSRADVDAALAACRPDVTFETIPFQATAHGTDEARRQFGAFFRAFPDYDVAVDDVWASDASVAAHGTIAATMAGPLAGLAPTGRRFRLPFACLWEVRDGLVAHERFFFDLHDLCAQLGLPTGEVAERLRAAAGGAR